MPVGVGEGEIRTLICARMLRHYFLTRRRRSVQQSKVITTAHLQLDGTLSERRGSGAQPFECPHCECRYKSLFDMQVHVMRKHTGTLKKTHKNTQWHLPAGERPYKCPQPGCSRAFVTPYALDNHRETHKANTKDYVCVQCQVRLIHCCFTVSCEQVGFKTERNLRKHNAVYHVEESDFRCEQCDLAFKTAAKRDSHLRQVRCLIGCLINMTNSFRRIVLLASFSVLSARENSSINSHSIDTFCRDMRMCDRSVASIARLMRRRSSRCKISNITHASLTPCSMRRSND